MIAIEELAALVKEMRGAQTDYFASKRHGDPSVSKRLLGESKVLEAKVDRLVGEICSGLDQGLLF